MRFKMWTLCVIVDVCAFIRVIRMSADWCAGDVGF